eukprot:3573581-Lingulodinium_polyedra.AAC.1
MGSRRIVPRPRATTGPRPWVWRGGARRAPSNNGVPELSEVRVSVFAWQGELCVVVGFGFILKPLGRRA